MRLCVWIKVFSSASVRGFLRYRGLEWSLGSRMKLKSPSKEMVGSCVLVASLVILSSMDFKTLLDSRSLPVEWP